VVYYSLDSSVHGHRPECILAAGSRPLINGDSAGCLTLYTVKDLTSYFLIFIFVLQENIRIQYIVCILHSGVLVRVLCAWQSRCFFIVLSLVTVKLNLQILLHLSWHVSDCPRCCRIFHRIAWCGMEFCEPWIIVGRVYYLLCLTCIGVVLSLLLNNNFYFVYNFYVFLLLWSYVSISRF